MKNIVGPAVRGEDLKFRDKDVSVILEQLGAGGSILLIGLRRIGKTSVMLGVCDEAPPDWTIEYHNVQGVRSPSAFFNIILQSLPKGSMDRLMEYWSKSRIVPDRILQFLKSNVRKLEGEGVGVEFEKTVVDYWQPLCQGVEHILGNLEKPFVLILDEFPFFIENMLDNGVSNGVVEEVLGQLRRWREMHSNFRIVVGGSISMDRILAKNGIRPMTITDLSRFYIFPYSDTQACAFLEELAKGYGLEWFDAAITKAFLDLIEDYYPFFLQAFFMQLRQHGGPSGVSLPEVFENYFIPDIRKSFFAQFLQRLKEHYGDEDRAGARVILDCVSTSENGRASYSLLRGAFSDSGMDGLSDLDDLLDALVADDFLFFNSRTREYSFATKLVGSWWRLTRGKR